MVTFKKALALLLALAMCACVFAACGGNNSSSSESSVSSQPESSQPESSQTESEVSSEAEPTEAPAESTATPYEQPTMAEINAATYTDLSEGSEGDYTELYTAIGKDVTVDQVIEDPDTGLVYIDVDGVRYELGMDFLSMAMVYNCTVPEGGTWETEDDVYASWWRWYIQRWNYLMPEVPLYSNEYYDVYNAQIKGVEEHPTNPYWGPESALIDWTSEKEDGSIILGNSTELSGRLRSSSFGVSAPGASDLAVENLITGLETVSTNKEGGYEVNPTVVKDLKTEDNADGSRTYTVNIYDDLVFSDGSPITAKNYLVTTLMGATQVSVQAGGQGTSGLNFVGYADYNAYTGPDSTEGSKVFAGIRLIDDYTFSVTVDPQYLPYYYAITYAGFSPQPLALWLGEGVDILDDGEGAYLSDEFYAMEGENYTHAEQINNAVWDHSTDYPYSGPYTIESYDEADHSAVLKVNPNFKGNYEGTKPAIETVVYKRIIAETQLADFQSGGVDVLSGVTGGDATDEALALVEANPDKYVVTHYSRAGYGKLGFRGDLGPAQFTAVRQAISYCMDRATFAKDFTGGYGGVTDGPYYTGAWMYQKAVSDGMLLNAYDTSVDKAIEVLEADGWIYDKDGNDYTEGVRYKKIPKAEMNDYDLTYASIDGTYTVTTVGEDCYMPLVLNWYGTSDNEFTDLLVTGFMENDNMKSAGFVVQQTVGDFNPMLDELYQGALGVSYNGTPTYNCFNFATGFNTAAYDYSYNWRLDPYYFENNSVCYVKDLADAYWVE